MGNISSASLLAEARNKSLVKKYGNDPSMWRDAGTASLLGADIAEGYNKWANASMKANALDHTQAEISNRADISIANILKEGGKVESAQAGAFIKSGVKLEGSALNVMSETLEKANEAARVKQREADFEKSQLEVQAAVSRTKAQYSTFETILNMGSTYATASAGAK